jgi:hypothetical protein
MHALGEEVGGGSEPARELGCAGLFTGWPACQLLLPLHCRYPHEVERLRGIIHMNQSFAQPVKWAFTYLIIHCC